MNKENLLDSLYRSTSYNKIKALLNEDPVAQQWQDSIRVNCEQIASEDQAFTVDTLVRNVFAGAHDSLPISLKSRLMEILSEFFEQYSQSQQAKDDNVEMSSSG
jgi:hypothetical protein